jgi:hypothetical protein
MLTFCPTIALTSVDFPALGNPTTATKPHRVDAGVEAASLTIENSLTHIANWHQSNERVPSVKGKKQTKGERKQ